MELVSTRFADAGQLDAGANPGVEFPVALLHVGLLRDRDAVLGAAAPVGRHRARILVVQLAPAFLDEVQPLALLVDAPASRATLYLQHVWPN